MGSFYGLKIRVSNAERALIGRMLDAYMQAGLSRSASAVFLADVHDLVKRLRLQRLQEEMQELRSEEDIGRWLRIDTMIAIPSTVVTLLRDVLQKAPIGAIGYAVVETWVGLCDKLGIKTQTPEARSQSPVDGLDLVEDVNGASESATRSSKGGSDANFNQNDGRAATGRTTAATSRAVVAE